MLGKAVHIETLPVGPLGCNCSIVADLEAKRAIVTDPGGDLDLIPSRLRPVVPGHGPSTTVGDERTTNPFLRAR